MKNTLWANHLDKKTVSVLNKSEFYTNEDFDDIPVLGLLLMIGIDREDVDELLKALFFEENTWRLGIKDILETATEREGHEYMRDIFEAYRFDDYPEQFYKMTVRELLDLEFIEERFIPFVTSLMQRYLKEQDENVVTNFVDRTDIEDNFEEIFEEISEPIPDDEIFSYDDEFNEDDDNDYDELDSLED